MKNIIQQEFKIKLIIIIYMLKSIFESTNNSINNRTFFYIMNYTNAIIEIHNQLILILF